MHVKPPVRSLAHVGTLLTIIAAVVIRRVWPCSMGVCLTCTALYAHVDMNPDVCAGHVEGRDSWSEGKRKDSLFLLWLLGSGLPTCAHRCACALVSVRFEATGLGAHCASRDQGSSVPFSICSAVSRGGGAHAALALAEPSLWKGGPGNAPGGLPTFAQSQWFLCLHPGPRGGGEKRKHFEGIRDPAAGPWSGI